jgi:hypothetical protein
MRTGPLVVARIVAAILGVVLVLAGLAGVLWALGRLDDVRLVSPARLDTGAVEQVAGQEWWPWALGALGLLLVLLALWWLTSLVPRRPMRRLDLPGSGASGRLSVAAGEVADALADSLRQRVDGQVARGQVVSERGRLVVENHVSMSPSTPLANAAAAAADTSSLARSTLGRGDLLYRATIEVPRRGSGRHDRVE